MISPQPTLHMLFISLYPTRQVKKNVQMYLTTILFKTLIQTQVAPRMDPLLEYLALLLLFSRIQSIPTQFSWLGAVQHAEYVAL